MASKNRSNKKTYVHRSNAVHLTLYSPYGDPVPNGVLNEATEVLTKFALDNELLIGIART